MKARDRCSGLIILKSHEITPKRAPNPKQNTFLTREEILWTLDRPSQIPSSLPCCRCGLGPKQDTYLQELPILYSHAVRLLLELPRRVIDGGPLLTKTMKRRQQLILLLLLRQRPLVEKQFRRIVYSEKTHLHRPTRGYKMMVAMTTVIRPSKSTNKKMKYWHCGAFRRPPTLPLQILVTIFFFFFFGGGGGELEAFLYMQTDLPRG